MIAPESETRLPLQVQSAKGTPPVLILLGLLTVAGYHAIAISSEQKQLLISKNLLPYNDRLDARTLEDIKRVVIHCTELPDLATAREYGERVHYAESGTGNSGHYYIDRDGAVQLWVELERVAHHVAGANRDSIGIELVNRGRYPNWHHAKHQTMTEAYTTEQIQALIALLNELRHRIPGMVDINGHEDLDRRRIPATDRPQQQISRKLDPGPLFPWDQVLTSTGLNRTVVSLDQD